MFRRTTSVATLVIAALVTVTTVLLGSLGGLGIWSELQRHRASLLAELQSTTRRMALDLALPLWNFDGAQLESLMANVMERNEVHGVVVEQPDVSAPGGVRTHALVRDAAWQAIPATTALATEGLLVERSRVLWAQEVIGSVAVLATPRFMEAEVRERLLWLALEILGLNVLLVVCLYALLRRIVLVPLAGVEQLARNAEAPGGQRHYGELESLRVSIERTFALLEGRYAALRKNQAMLSSVLNSVPQSVFWKDEAGRYLGCNDVFARAAGLADASAVIGKTDLELPWPREHAEAYRADDREVIDSGRHKRRILEQLRRADGTDAWVETTKVPLKDGEERTYGVLGVFDDVSERIAAEAARQALEDRLRQSQKMEAVGTLAAGIAHDFNNIIAAILGNCDLALRDAGVEARVRTALAEIDRAGRRARSLVQQIVGFSRPHADSAERVELPQLVAEIERLMRSSIPVGVALETRCGDAIPAVLADPTQLHQVLVNLYTNAWQALEGRAGRIEIALTRVAFATSNPLELPAGDYACVSVSDTGKGMPPEVRDCIFEPFFTTKPRDQGTGLGLFTVHRIVRALRGAIAVDSTVGQGSTFRVYLPATERTRAPAPGPVVHVPSGRSQRVIYVDDEEALVFLVSRQLEVRGYEVRGFTSAEAALDAIVRDPAIFDVLVSDYNMPRMTGLDLVQRVLEQRSDARLILTSGFISEEMERAAADLGVRALIYKPNDVEELCEAIDRCALAPAI